MAGTVKKPQQPSEPEGIKKNSIREVFSNKAESINLEHREILDWLKDVRFKKQLFGGVSEQDVWKKLEELNNLFDAALKAERSRFEVLLEEHQRSMNKFQHSIDPEEGRDIDD